MRFLILFFCLHVSVYSQVNDRQRPESLTVSKGDAVRQRIEDAMWRRGAFYITPIIGIDNVGYDDNVFSTEDNESSDVSAIPKVGLQSWWRINANWIWANRADYGYRYYFDADELRGSNYNAESRVYGLFKRIYLDFGADYVFDQGRLNSEIDERRSSKRTGFDVNLSLQPTPRGLFNLTSRWDAIEFDDSGFGPNQSLRNLDRDGLLFEVEYLYKLRARFWPFVGLTQRSFDFDQPGNPRDESRFAGGHAGVRNKTGERFHYIVRFGFQDLSFDNAPQADDTIVTNETFAEYQLSKRTFIRTTLRRAPVFSTSTNHVFFTSTRGEFSVGFKPGEQVRFIPGITLGSNDYDKQLLPVTPNRKDDIRAFSFQVEMPIRKSLQLDVALGYLERDSNYAGLSNEGVTFYANIRYRK